MRKTRGSWGETYFRFARLYVPAKLSESRASYFRFPRLYVPAILSESLAQATSVPAVARPVRAIRVTRGGLEPSAID